MSGNHSTRLAAVRLIAALALALTLWPAMARPVAAATYTVNTTSDVSDSSCSDGSCSLRDAIILANNNPGADIISFSIPGCGGVCTIQPTSQLPVLSGGGTTIDGYSQPGSAPASGSTPATLLIQISGSSAGSTARGLVVTSASNVIRGLAINRFQQPGVYIYGTGATGNVVSGNHIGTDAAGTADLGNVGGVFIEIDASNNIVGGGGSSARNVISGNADAGVRLYDSNTTGNVVSGNYIGTDAYGTADLGNSASGVRIGNGAHDNTIGGTTISEHNIISGNDSDGVAIDNATSNAVTGNHIGTDVDGAVGLGNSDDGVSLSGGATGNTIGGNQAGEQNLISGNSGDGVDISGSSTMSNTVSANYIGLSADGTADLGNAQNGVSISGGAHGNTVGGNASGERNRISGNGGSGVYIFDSATMSNTVSGNYIGTNAAGTAALSNDYHGVNIYGAPSNTIGGDASGEGNLISGNAGRGVSIYGSASISNTVSGNVIGLNAAGTAVLSNTLNGINIDGGAHGNTIGGDTADERNVISGNGAGGVSISDSSTMSNTVSGNYIGTNSGGLGSLGNGQGVAIGSGAQDNTVGPDNLIAHNSGDGVSVSGSSATRNTITQNSIFSNDMGIDLVSGANGAIAAPVIVTTTAGSVNIVGSACPNCTVEVFENGDTDGEGKTYVGAATATR